MENIIFGKKVVFDIIKTKSNQIFEVLIDSTIKLTKEERELLINSSIKHNFIDKKTINNMAGENNNHQGVIAKVKEFNYTHFNEILKFSRVLILDRIQDPHNLGAIIRSAVLFGVEVIIMLDHKQVEINSTVIKTSAGSVYNMRICRVPNIVQAIQKLKENGFWIYCSSLENSINMIDVDFAERHAIIIGNEGDGVADLIVKNSDVCFKISTNDKANSLNVSVATGIILFHSFK